MTNHDRSAGWPTIQTRIDFQTLLVRSGTTILLFSLLVVQPVVAQSSGEAFCQTDMALTIQNLFTIIQFGGPLIGGLIALGAIVVTPTIRRADLKKEVKEIRNQGIVWGVIVAPLGTAIIQFLLNDVVAGGVSCGF